MHKKPLAGKKTGVRMGLVLARGSVPATSRRRRHNASATGHRVPHSVKELLAHHAARGPLAEIQRALPTQRSWHSWLCERLPADLARHVVSVVPKAGTVDKPAVAGGLGSPPQELVVFVDSAVWCARLRYACAALAAEPQPAPSRLSVRVQIPRDPPRG